jgi:hypothetical protein
MTKDDDIKKRIIAIEDNLMLGHRTSNPVRKTHTCRFCERTFSWFDTMEHDEFCPITLMSNLRKEKGIPSWMARSILKNTGS